MMEFDVRFFVKDAMQYMSRVQKSQIPYATMVALSRTARDMRLRIVDMIPERFNVTRKWWLPRQPTGIRTQTATKANLSAAIYSRAYFLPLQEDGGVKFPDVGRGLLIPTYLTPKRARISGRHDLILDGPRTLRKGGKAGGSPIFTMKSGKMGVFRRKTKKRLPVNMMYTFKPSALVRKRFGFAKEIERHVYKTFKLHFFDALANAVRTMR
jgi:hypothetical protein